MVVEERVLSEPERHRDGVRLAGLLGGPTTQALLAADRAGVANPAARIAERLDAKAETLTAPGGALEALGLDDLAEPIRQRVWRAFADAEALWPELETPTVAHWTEQGLDLGALAARLEADDQLEVVLTPLGQGSEQWIAAFDRCEGAPKLTLSSEIVAEFQLLEWPIAVDAAEGSGAERSANTRVSVAATFWSLAVVPGGQAPPLLGQNHRHGPHPRLAEMLTLQLMRARRGGEYVDARTFTWIAGRLGEGRLAARHVYDEHEHSIRVSTREWAQQGPHQGARPPLLPPNFAETAHKNR